MNSISLSSASFYWIFAISILVWMGTLIAIGYFLIPQNVEPGLLPIEARIIELPAPKKVSQAARPSITKSAHNTVVLHEPTYSSIKPEKKSPVKKLIPSTPEKIETERIEKSVTDTSSIKSNTNYNPVESKNSTPATATSNGNEGSAGTVSIGAKAIYKPTPTIPEDLADEAIGMVIEAQFHINSDGTFTVELTKPTANPRINQLFNNSLKTWKWSPEIKDGKPVSSTKTIRMPVAEVF